ncbi:MAG: molybdate ABC transporter substrate-binding protein [Neisseriales bacterium]|nr:MAG: molybdate ABC transporter substrate-binding protein [Neisseriales bacterium]
MLLYQITLRKLCIRLSYCFLLCLPLFARAEILQIAVAANVQEPFEEIAKIFQIKTGIEVKYTIGSTGKFVAQIIHGAPFDLLLSADMEYLAKLHQMHLTASTPKSYASARLILWTTHTFDLKNWVNLLQSNQIKRIAIAHPDFAPFGKIALKVLQACHLINKIEHKLVYGNSVAQTNQYIATGHADLGFTAQSIIFTQAFAKAGKWIFIPQHLYPSIKQGVVIIKSTRHLAAARKFIELLNSSTAHAIFKRYGYRLHNN